MTTTMQLIAKQTVGSGGAASVTFSSIPQQYTDLKLIISGRLDHTQYGNPIMIKPNGSSANASTRLIRGYDGTGVQTYTLNYLAATDNDLGDGSTAGIFTSSEVYIFNYSSNSLNKILSSYAANPNTSSGGRTDVIGGLWSNTAPITYLTIDSSIASRSFKEFTTFYLYGISNSTTTQATTVPYASGGDVIATDGSYWYHAFKYSGSFTPLKDIEADVLVVAGGGGGSGAYEGAGAGAGGIQYLAGASLTTTSYTCSIGSGGAGKNVNGGSSNGADGGNSVFGGTITANGGGGAGGYNSFGNSNNGNAGGSGGGTSRAASGGASNQSSSGGATSYGNAGGNGGNSSGFAGSGGGGAGAAGQVFPAQTTGGNGGIGLSTWSSWANATFTGQNGYYAGGGGGCLGGLGGLGGGGNSAIDANASNGLANTGGGGGGSTSSTADKYGGNGGSGIIIVRYAV